VAHRIQFITHQAKQILLVDLSNCSAGEVEKIARTVPEVVTTLSGFSLDTFRLPWSIV
jgi:hypothetical protein